MSEIVTSIVAGGYVIADYDTAHFSLSFSEYAPKAKAAKAKLKKGVDKINVALAELKEKGLKMVVGTYLTGPTVAPNYVYDQVKRVNVLDGQKATYTVSFQTQSMDLVNEVYDELSDLDLNELTLKPPTYSVKAEAALKQTALEDAWKVAQVLFANQCRVLGLDANNYAVSTWAVNYSGEDHYGGGKFRNSTVALAEGGGGFDDDAIEINAGKAKVKVLLTANYTRARL